MHRAGLFVATLFLTAEAWVPHRPFTLLLRSCRYIGETTPMETDLSYEPFDLVVYALETPSLDGKKSALGVVLEDGAVQPLCAWSIPATELVWDEEVETVDSSRILGRLDCTVFYEQRQQARIHNPHGEHSEDVFVLRDNPIKDDVFVQQRPERESIW